MKLSFAGGQFERLPRIADVNLHYYREYGSPGLHLHVLVVMEMSLVSLAMPPTQTEGLPVVGLPVGP